MKGSFHKVFNLRDDLAKGRCCTLTSSVLDAMISALTTGLFYTGFLALNGINIVEVGILTFIPFIANCFSIFTPRILEPFSRRRWVLAASRLMYYVLNILGVTVLPYLVRDPALQMPLFIAVVFVANVINALFTGGYDVWHVKFLPEEVRADYFGTRMLLYSFLGQGAGLFAGLAADALAGSPHEETILIWFRIAGFLLAVLNVVVLSLPKEFPYTKEADIPRIRDVIVKPLKNRAFASTMLIVALFYVGVQIPASSLNYFLLYDVGASYTLINAVEAAYPLFLFLFLPFWKKILKRTGWFEMFALGVLLHVPTTLLYSCISPANFLWVLPTVRLAQHFFGVGRNLASANMLYVNLPKADQTNYISFHTLILNASHFFGRMLGTALVSAFPDASITLFGVTFGIVQMLLWAEVFSQLLIPLLIWKWLPRLRPAEAE